LPISTVTKKTVEFSTGLATSGPAPWLIEIIDSSFQVEQPTMSHGASTIGPPSGYGEDSFDWVRFLPDGAVSVEKQNGGLVLRASQQVQERFEKLLQRRKAGTLTPVENEQYEAICELDDALSWLNRLARSPQRTS
jgi:hypothetical protein